MREERELAATGRRIIEDLEQAGVDPIVVKLVRYGLASLAEQIRSEPGALVAQGGRWGGGYQAAADALSRYQAAALVDPGAE